MSETKLFISKRSTNLLLILFSLVLYLCLLIKNISNDTNFWFPKNNQKRYTIYFKLFFIGHEVFVLIVKNVIKMKNSILHKIYAEYIKNVKKKNCSCQKDLQIFCQVFFLKTYTFP